MTLSEFVEDLTREMLCNNWQNKPVRFKRDHDRDLFWLDIYEHNESVVLDVGDEGEFSGLA